jgi:hypothetical protein
MTVFTALHTVRCVVQCIRPVMHDNMHNRADIRVFIIGTFAT